MSEMVDRVGAAIAGALNPADPNWLNVVARAAIEAMRDEVAVLDDGRSYGDPDMDHGSQMMLAEVLAMIDAALKD